MAAELGPWAPLPVAEAAAVFAGAPFRWWFSGGRALDLHLGRSWRDHSDTDIGIRRTDAPRLAPVLAGWDIAVAAAGRLSPWSGRPLLGAAAENNLWCRPGPGAPWALDVTVGEGDDSHWIYRRDPRLRVRWDSAVLRTADGLPYLAPELQLLFKAGTGRAKDDHDAAEVVPALDAACRARLAALLPPGHPWLA